MRRIRHLSIVAALWLGGSTAASAGPLDAALSAFLACNAGSIAKIGESKAVFGPVTIESRPGTRKTDPPSRYELDVATFSKPIEINGLHLIAFERYVVFSKGKPSAVSFGFRTAESSAEVAASIGPLLKDVDFQQHEDQFGWLVELEPDWHTDGDGSAVEHRHPIRFLLVSPSPVKDHPGAAMIQCDLAKIRVSETPPPKLTEIFASAAPSGALQP